MFEWKVAAVEHCQKLYAFLGDKVKTERYYYFQPAHSGKGGKWHLISEAQRKAQYPDQSLETFMRKSELTDRVPGYDLQELARGTDRGTLLLVDDKARDIIVLFEKWAETIPEFITNYNKEG